MRKDYSRKKRRLSLWYFSGAIIKFVNDSAELDLFLSRSNFIKHNLSTRYQERTVFSCLDVLSSFSMKYLFSLVFPGVLTLNY